MRYPFSSYKNTSDFNIFSAEKPFRLGLGAERAIRLQLGVEQKTWSRAISMEAFTFGFNLETPPTFKLMKVGFLKYEKFVLMHFFTKKLHYSCHAY